MKISLIFVAFSENVNFNDASLKFFNLDLDEYLCKELHLIHTYSLQALGTLVTIPYLGQSMKSKKT